MKKLFRIICNKIQEIKYQKAIKKQAVATRKLRIEKRSDYARWEKTEQLCDDWNERTAILADLIKPGSQVVEFGAGNMALKKYLPPDCTYTPSDIYKRSEEMLECDLNSKIKFDLTPFDTAVFSGVFEYVYDIEKVFKQLNPAINNIVLSYACSDISSANRLNSGWLSDYSKKELGHIFAKFNYRIVEYREWRKQSIYSLKK